MKTKSMKIIIAKSMRLWVHIKGQRSLAHNQHACFLWAAYISPYHKGKPYTCGELFLSDVHDHTELKCYRSEERPYHKGKPYTCGELFLSDVHDHTELKCYWKSKQRNKKPTPHCWQSFIKTLHADTSRLHVANCILRVQNVLILLQCEWYKMK